MDEFIKDILKRKEFYELKIPDDLKEEWSALKNDNSNIDDLIKEVGILRLRSHQLFVKRL